MLVSSFAANEDRVNEVNEGYSHYVDDTKSRRVVYFISKWNETDFDFLHFWSSRVLTYTDSLSVQIKRI